MAGIRAFFRLAKAGYILAREGVVTAAAPPNPPPIGRLALAVARIIERRGVTARSRGAKVSEALHRLGPSFVKLGQFLATRPDIIGQRLADDLTALQDQVKALPLAEIRPLIETQIGKPLDMVFADISEAVAAASVAQVHRARILGPEGEARTIALKILRPGVAERFHDDLDGFYLAARLIERFVPASRRLRPLDVVDVLARTVRMEMDLRLEAAAISEMAENTTGDPGFRLPVIHWELTRQGVLALEWIDGIKLSDVERLRNAGLDLKALARTVIQSFLRHSMRDGFFHADMHQGNLFADLSGTLIAVDLGIVGRLSHDDRRFLAEILLGFITRDYRRVSDVHFEAGLVPPTESREDFAQAIRAIGEPIRGQTAANISMASLLGQLLDYTDVFNMKTQPRLVLLQKTMVVVEGVARTLDPDLDIWTVSEPVVREVLERDLGIRARLEDVGGSLSAAGQLALKLPAFAERLDTISAGFARMVSDGLTMDRATVDEIAKAEAHRTRSGRVALWIMAIAVVLAAGKILLH